MLKFLQIKNVIYKNSELHLKLVFKAFFFKNHFL